MNTDAKHPRYRRGHARPDMRAALLDAAEALIREEGYAAATARKIASVAGLKHQAIFYYFGSQDELLVEVFRRFAASNNERLTKALASDAPLSAMWRVLCDPATTRLTIEFMALAYHNEFLRAEIAANAQEVRRFETEAIARHLAQRGIEPRLSPQLVSVLTNAMARLLVQEASLGIHLGHDEALSLSDASFAAFEALGGSPAEFESLVGAMSGEGKRSG